MHLKQGTQEFHRKYVLVPADKAANNVVVVCRLHYIDTLKQELDDTRAFKETDSDKISVANAHLNELKFVSVSMKTKTNILRCIGYLDFKLRVRLWPCKIDLSPPVTLCY